jgi:hypothetical protein
MPLFRPQTAERVHAERLLSYAHGKHSHLEKPRLSAATIAASLKRPRLWRNDCGLSAGATTAAFIVPFSYQLEPQLRFPFPVHFPLSVHVPFPCGIPCPFVSPAPEPTSQYAKHDLFRNAMP